VPEVIEKIKQQFESASKCLEPEETIRLRAADLIGLCLEKNEDPDKEINVSAYGSQSAQSYDDATRTWSRPFRNSLNITITPLG